MAFLMIGFIFASLSTVEVAAIALLFSLGIELSQLYHAPWIDDIRQYRLGALVLGHGFLWTDLVCYSFGVAMGVVGEMMPKPALKLLSTQKFINIFGRGATCF